jgi:hypothetical protein
MVHAEDIHYFVTVNALNLAQVPYFVGKNHLGGVKSIIGVLDHLGYFDRRVPDGCVDVFVKLGRFARGLAIVGP